MSAHKYWLGFNVVKGIGPVRLRALRQFFGALETAWHASEIDLVSAGLDHHALENLNQARRSLNLDKMLNDVDDLGAIVITLDDADYPDLLRELPDAPPLLYVKGTLLAADDWAVAFVGTRRASPYGRDITRELVIPLVNAGITIVSGLAAGIDSVAHRSALDQGGRTLAVMGCGIDQVYPSEHRLLAAEIAQNGALITQFPPGTPPEGRNFPMRNRTMSGLALGVVVVEAPAQSGSLLTADHAIDQGRDVFAIPGNLNSPNSQGTNRLIQIGAKLVMRGEDILDELNLTRGTVEMRVQAREIVPANATEEALARLLTQDPLHIDELCELSGLSITEVSSVLSLMELKGLARRVEGMRYTLPPRGGGDLYRLD